MIEVELRYKVTDAEDMIAHLRQNDVKVASEQRVVDKWFVPAGVHSRTEHDTWFDEDHGTAYRIRKTELSNGDVRIVLDSKQHTDANNHNTFKEDVIIRDDEPAMLEFLQSKDYYNWLTLDKKRTLFSSYQKELLISMDTVDGIKDDLGIDTVLEIEYSGDGSREEALNSIRKLASNLGLNSDDLFEKSLTVESMKVLARFQ